MGDTAVKPVLINQSYRMQRVTGQQRYAAEISQRLLKRPGFTEIAPEGWWAGSAVRVWAWVFLILPIHASRSALLSMTARSAVWKRAQILVIHDLFVLTNPEWFSRKYVITHAPVLRIQLKRAAAMIAVSEPVAAELARLYRGPVAVAPNAASETFFARDEVTDAETLASRGLVAGRYLLAVGSIDPRKNLPRLAQAYAALSEDERSATPLVVVGGGNAIYRDQAIVWPSETIHAGYVTDDELRALYAGSRAVVFVSLAEGFGLPLVEAAAAGSARFVISDIPVFRWICGEGAVYVDPNSVEQITEGFRQVIAGSGSLLRPPTGFSWDASAETVAELCLRVNEGTRNSG